MGKALPLFFTSHPQGNQQQHHRTPRKQTLSPHPFSKMKLTVPHSLASMPPSGRSPCACAYPVANSAIQPNMAWRPFHRSALALGPNPNAATAGYRPLKSAIARSKTLFPAMALFSTASSSLLTVSKGVPLTTVCVLQRVNDRKERNERSR